MAPQNSANRNINVFIVERQCCCFRCRPSISEPCQTAVRSTSIQRELFLTTLVENDVCVNAEETIIPLHVDSVALEEKGGAGERPRCTILACVLSEKHGVHQAL